MVTKWFGEGLWAHDVKGPTAGDVDVVWIGGCNFGGLDRELA